METSSEFRIFQLIPAKIRDEWLKQLYDSKLFNEGDDKSIQECLQYWGIFIGRLLKKHVYNDRQDFIGKASKQAHQQYPLYQQHGWMGLTLPPPTKIPEEEEGEEEEDDDEWFEFINTDFFLIFNFLLDFVSSSAFQFELFKTIFTTPEVIKDVQYELPYTMLWPKMSYIQESNFTKLKNVIGPAYDFTPINHIPDTILPLSMSPDVNEDFWIEMMNESYQKHSVLSSQQVGGSQIL